MTRRTLERDFPNFRWCIGPGCTFGQEHPDSSTTQPIIICSACGFISCSQHNVPWHSGQTCEEFEKVRLAGRSKEEKKTEKIIKSIAKRCPGCKRFINKNGGCNHMSCKLDIMNQSRASCADEYPLQVCVGGISVGIVCMSLQGIHGVVRGCTSRN
jgi:hypothetical protein